MMHSTSARKPRQQKGAALLTAMITLALVATLAAGALWRQWRGVEVEAAERSRVQASWILTGALDWGRLILQGDLAEDTRKRQLVDHLDEPWAVPLAEARLSTFLAAGQSSTPMDRDAFLSGQIEDQQARLNIMNLAASSPEQQMQALLQFERLFDLLGLPGGELGALQRGLVRAQTAMYGEQQAGDAALLPQRVEQLLWLGLSETSLQRLAPHVSMLPLQGGQITPVNLNTAGLEVLQAVWPGLDRARAQRLVQLRERQPLRTVQEAAQALDLDEIDANWGAVSSSFFQIRGRLRLDDLALEETALVQRRSDVRGRQVQTLWRQRQALGAGQALAP